MDWLVGTGVLDGPGANGTHYLYGHRPSERFNLYLPQRGRGTIAKAMVDEEIIAKSEEM